MIADVLLPLLTVGLAEMGDKTQLSILFLASRTKNHLKLLLGVMIGFLIVDGVAVLIGSSVAHLLPIIVVKIFSGVVFVVFGLLTLRREDKLSESRLHSKNPFLSGFTLIFLAEWGDKTQIAAALFATEYNPMMVLLGTMISLGAQSAIAVCVGRIILQRIDKKLMARVSGLAFILVGLSFFLL